MKALAWLKSYWYVPLALVAVIISYFVFGRRDKAIGDVLKAATKNHDAQIKAIDKATEEKEERDHKVLNTYLTRKRKIEKDYRARGKELSTKKNKELKKLVEKHYDDPNGLAKELENAFGIKHKK